MKIDLKAITVKAVELDTYETGSIKQQGTLKNIWEKIARKEQTYPAMVKDGNPACGTSKLPWDCVSTKKP